MTETTYEDRARRIRGLLQSQRNGHAPRVEHGGGGDGGDLHPDDVLQRLCQFAERLPDGEHDDPDALKCAMRMLVEHGEPALRKLFAPNPSALHLSADQLASAEALVVADGTRPSFLLRNGQFAQDHPLLGTWRGDLENFRPMLGRLAASVGRIQPPGGGPARYSGTGTLVDAAKGLVLTNYHVVEHARQQYGVVIKPDGKHRKVENDWFIDFVGESGNPSQNRWRIKEVRFPEGFGESFGGLDAAVLQIESADAHESILPETAIVLSSNLDYADGAGNSTLVTIGFPAEPNFFTPPGATIDWNFVVKTIFNNRFGVKRVAPGKFLDRAGTVSDDEHGHVLSYDPTTFGGASGSLVFAWKDEGSPAFALHFAGETLTANYGVSLYKAADALRKIGLTMV